MSNIEKLWELSVNEALQSLDTSIIENTNTIYRLAELTHWLEDENKTQLSDLFDKYLV